MPVARTRVVTIEYRRSEVARLYLQGSTQHGIARELGCSQQTVSDDLRHLREEWVESASIATPERIAEELAKIDDAEREAWEGYRRSCKDSEVETELEESARIAPARGNGQGRMVVVRQSKSKSRKGQAGDTRWLQQAYQCRDQRLRLLGLLKPDRNVNITQVSVDWSGLFSSNGSSQVAPQISTSQVSPISDDSIEQRIAEVESLPTLPSTHGGVNGENHHTSQPNGDGHE